MPGKVNPVMSEMLLMICAQVVGNDATIGWGGAAGNFELNVMIPVMAYNLLHSIGILADGCRLFASRCVEGIEPNEERCAALDRAEPGDGDGAERGDRLRRRGGDRQGIGQDREDGPRALPREERPAARTSWIDCSTPVG